MCNVATINPNALPLLLAAFALTVSVLFEGQMTSEALPIMRQERSVDTGPIHGSEFLSLLLDPSVDRKPRSATNFDYRHEKTRRTRPTIGKLFELNRSHRLTSENTNSEGLVLAVRVSSSVGKTLINKTKQRNYERNKNELDDPTTPSETTNEITPTDRNTLSDLIDQISIASEDHPSIAAEASKNEFNIEEKEPTYTSNVDQQLPDFHPPPELLKRAETQVKVHPYHQTLIYHDNGDNHARSVSYSTVAQGDQSDDDDKMRPLGRQERHYDSSKSSDYTNNFNNVDKRPYNATTQTTPSSNTFNEQNWGSPEKPSRPHYAQPEQNYEVDEAVSVVTNGRTHGVQPKQNDYNNKKKDDNQKVGYVVEGRNYKKYRVEERTSDGFIVGEYGVVSHDDGSLRGVRYTADGSINPRLIYDALMKFLSL